MTLTVIMLDEITHTVEQPECSNPDCICHVEEAWDELQRVPSYVEMEADAFASEK